MKKILMMVIAIMVAVGAFAEFTQKPTVENEGLFGYSIVDEGYGTFETKNEVETFKSMYRTMLKEKLNGVKEILESSEDGKQAKALLKKAVFVETTLKDGEWVVVTEEALTADKRQLAGAAYDAALIGMANDKSLNVYEVSYRLNGYKIINELACVVKWGDEITVFDYGVEF